MSSGAGEIRVLHVDDERDFGEIVSMHLERIHDEIAVTSVGSAQAGLDRLDAESFDCVVSDHDMPTMDGLEFLRRVREKYPDLPFVLFTGKGNEEIASDAISAGVTEYLQKDVGTDQYTVLANRIERAVGERRAKTALEESERMLSTLISNLPGMVYRARNEPDWPMEFVSDGADDLVGYSAEALESGAVSWESLICDDETDRLWTRVQTCIDAGEPFEVSYRARTAEGEIRWFWERGRVVGETDDGVEILEGFITDITARRQREQELEREREFTEDLIDAIDDAFYLVGTDGHLIRWNDTLATVTGYSDQELSGMHGTELLSESAHDDFEAALDPDSDAVDDAFQAPLSTADGEEIPYEFRGSIIRDRDGEVIGIAGIGRDITERRDRERKLEQYETLVENVGDPMFILDETGRIRTANRAMAEYLGEARSEVVGSLARSYIHDEDHWTGLELTKDLLRSGGKDWGTYEMRVTTADGEQRVAENNMAVLTDGEAFMGTVGVVRDVTERKQRQRKLRQYETLVENVGDAMYVLDESGTIQMVNEAMADHLGYDRDEIVGAEPTEFMPESDVQEAAETIQQLLEDDERIWATFEMETIDAAGERTINEDKIAPLIDDEEFVGSVGVIRDITDRKDRERELERYETIVQAVGDPVYTLDDDGVFTFVNDAIESLTGYTPEELIGEHIGAIMTDDDIERGQERIQELLADPDRDHATLEMDVVTRWGDQIPCENNIALLPSEDGTFTGSAGVIRDVADRVERERRLSEFASVVSHDLRNPLNVVQGRLSLAVETGDISHLEDAIDSADRMEQLIGELLTLAREGETIGETNTVEIDPVAKQAWDTVDTPVASLSVADSTTVEADAPRLRELLGNLFRNSVEHGSTGNRTASDDSVEHSSTGSRSGADDSVEHGSTGNRTEPDDGAGSVTVTVGALNGSEGFYVEDDGPGIPESERETVFERGYTTSRDGTGFGLAIVQEIAQAHGWAVELTESGAGGARFEFTTSRDAR